MHLIGALVEQLGAELKMSGDKGACCKVIFADGAANAEGTT
jgi:two-component sensor histidine kinase